jgi:hypothetical protein
MRDVPVVIHCSRTRWMRRAFVAHTLDGHTGHLPGAHRFEDRLGVGTIGLVATDVRAYVGRRHECHLMAVVLRDAAQ